MDKAGERAALLNVIIKAHTGLVPEKRRAGTTSPTVFSLRSEESSDTELKSEDKLTMSQHPRD